MNRHQDLDEGSTVAVVLGIIVINLGVVVFALWLGMMAIVGRGM